MSDTSADSSETIEQDFDAYPPALRQDFETARQSLVGILSSAELDQWTSDGMALAQYSLRSWEAAGEYFRASPDAIKQLPFNRFREWAKIGAELLDASPALTGAFFRSSPTALPYLSIAQARVWAGHGRSLYKDTWKSGSLSAQYFETSPEILQQLPLNQMRLLIELVDSLAKHSYELASSCLAMAPNVLGQLDRPDRAPFLEFGAIVANTAWVDARIFFERGPELIQLIHPQQRARFLSLAGRVSLDIGRLGHPYFIEASQSIGLLDRDQHRDLLNLADGLTEYSGIAAMEFIKSTPSVLQQLRVEDLERWQMAGSTILKDSVEGGEAFFRLESSKGEDVIEALSSRVELDRIGDLIRMYCKALTGVDVAVQSTEQLTEKGVGWVDSNSPTTEGSAIYLPPAVEHYPSKNENFSVYKVFATHQAARLEFGSFRFVYDQPGEVFGQQGRDARYKKSNSDSAPITAMERFFDLFEDRQLAHDIFTIVEDTRIDTIVKREYAGIRSAMGSLQEDAANQRKAIEDMPARKAMVENLLRASLDEFSHVHWPAHLDDLMQEPLRILGRIRRERATVEDSAEAALLLYDWISRVPNVVLEDSDWAEMNGTEATGEDEGEFLPSPAGSDGQEALMPTLPSVGEQLYESPDPVDFRGDFKPELVQLLLELRAQDMEGDVPPVPLTKEQLKELLEKNVEVNINELNDGQLDESSGIFLDNLMQEIQDAQQRANQSGEPGTGENDSDDESELEEINESYYYDEWDFRASDYKPRWCRVEEMRLEAGATDYYDGALAEHAALVRETRRQFEQLKPEMFRKIKRLPDGEDFDLDAVVEWIVERKAHAATDSKVYFSRNKLERDVAVAFLLDMSASTDEEIIKHQPRAAGDIPEDDPRKYLSWWAQKQAQESKNPSKRIIDLEREAAVLFIEALETIGDTYGVYGFSGYGRDNVEFYVIKDLDEMFGDTVKKRIDKVSPVRSTRMGPAIRHCIFKLNETKARVKILVLLSDGRPQDHGYGRDRTEKEYAIHDTKMALMEARREGMTPFCLTVDRAGHDYLQQMCTDMGYEIVSDIQSLPRRLPTLYRRLTQ